MALQQLLKTKPSGPYARLPPIQIHVLAKKEHIRVLSWNFTSNTVTPIVTKKNQMAAITDGSSTAKIVLFEEFADLVQEGKNYLMRGYSLRGDCPPYYILITKKTQFMRSSPVNVSQQLVEEAAALLDPPSQQTHVRDISQTKGFFTVEGTVIEVSFQTIIIKSLAHYI